MAKTSLAHGPLDFVYAFGVQGLPCVVFELHVDQSDPSQADEVPMYERLDVQCPGFGSQDRFHV